MIKILIAVLLIYLLWQLLPRLIYWTVGWWVRRLQRKAFQQAFGGRQPGGFGNADPAASTRRHRQDGSARRDRREKIFSREDGEYVEFEEIAADPATTDGRPGQADSSTRFVKEEQVSDAEWTDI